MYRRIVLQEQDFDLTDELVRLVEAVGSSAAIATFTGSVRPDEGVEALFLEHYSGMTERALEEIAERAFKRWPLQGLVLIHRIGRLVVGEQIVGVITAAAHRQPAFSANAFIMDFLKTEVPLWKQAIGPEKTVWIQTTQADLRAAKSWSE